MMKGIRRFKNQPHFDVRFYRVSLRGESDEILIQAPTPAKAKYRVFQLVREDGGCSELRSFLSLVTGVRELRR